MNGLLLHCATIVAVMATSFIECANAQVVETIAGNGTQGYFGDNGPASSALLNNPRGIAVDSAGNIYIADTGNFRVRRIDPSGTISTFAGTGTEGFSGDGGPALDAQFTHPTALALAPNGDLYIVDYGRIRRVGANGNISTFAGTGVFSDSGSGIPATSAWIAPDSIAIDSSSNLYLSERDYGIVRKVTPGGTITYAVGQGFGLAFLGTEAGVGVDNNGNLIVVDLCLVRGFNASFSPFQVAGSGSSSCGYSGDGGPATSAQVAFPSALTLDAAGNIYFFDLQYHVIRRVGLDGTINTFVGNGGFGFSADSDPPTSTSLSHVPAMSAGPDGFLYIAEATTNRARKVGVDPKIVFRSSLE